MDRVVREYNCGGHSREQNDFLLYVLDMNGKFYETASEEFIGENVLEVLIELKSVVGSLPEGQILC